jgi:hypothetical protein
MKYMARPLDSNSAEMAEVAGSSAIADFPLNGRTGTNPPVLASGAIGDGRGKQPSVRCWQFIGSRMGIER